MLFSIETAIRNYALEVLSLKLNISSLETVIEIIHCDCPDTPIRQVGAVSRIRYAFRYVSEKYLK
jgi:hypothetical protein